MAHRMKHTHTQIIAMLQSGFYRVVRHLRGIKDSIELLFERLQESTDQATVQIKTLTMCQCWPHAGLDSTDQGRPGKQN